MIVLDLEQGSRAWVEARLGIPTASEFSRVVTPGGKLSASRADYLGDLLAEWALGEPVKDFKSDWMEWGNTIEPDARNYYAFQCDAEVTTVGFVYRDETRMAGCSPDGLVGDGALELKCPKAGTHLRWLAVGKIPREHAIQVQGQLWVTGLPWIDFMSFYPGLPPLIVRAEPDEMLQRAFDEAIPAFVEEVISGRRRLREMGVQPAAPTAQEAKAAPEPELADYLTV